MADFTEIKFQYRYFASALNKFLDRMRDVLENMKFILEHVSLDRVAKRDLNSQILRCTIFDLCGKFYSHCHMNEYVMKFHLNTIRDVNFLEKI